MKHLSKCLALVLAAALMLGLAACGKDTTGDDWRASGVVTDYGTITRDGERVPVCICLSTETPASTTTRTSRSGLTAWSFPWRSPTR